MIAGNNNIINCTNIIAKNFYSELGGVIFSNADENIIYFSNAEFSNIYAS